MISQTQVKSAADELLAAALLGGGWADALQRLGDAASAGGVTLMRLKAGSPSAALSSSGWAEADEELMSGRAPPSRFRFFPDHVLGNGFRADQDVWRTEELRRDPYFQEFLRPRGVFFHARARLCFEHGERVSISLKRQSQLGPYEPADVAVLDSLLPELRATVRLARCMLDAEASGMVRVIHQRGDPVFELDASGRVLRVHGCAGPSGIIVRHRKLFAVERLAQGPLDQAIAVAATPPRRPSLAAITDKRGARRFLRIVPVTGSARDVFIATAAIAVVVEPPRQPAAIALPANEVREALGLTMREGEVASLLAEGLSLPEVASRLRLQVGTVRNHLKNIFEKTGTRRQGEMIALLHRIRS